MKSGYSATSHRDEQDGEHGSQRSVIKASINREIHLGVCYQQPYHSASDHSDKHKSGHVVARLLEHPHRQNSCEKNVHKGDVAPHGFAQDQRQIGTDGKGEHDKQDADRAFFPASKVQLFLQQSKHDSKNHKHDGDHACGTVSGSSIGQCTICP